MVAAGERLGQPVRFRAVLRLDPDWVMAVAAARDMVAALVTSWLACVGSC